MSTANRGMSDIKTIREALEWVNARYDETEIIKRALAALSHLAEPGEDAREVAESIWDIVHMAGGPMTEECAMCEASALIERYAAARESKAREEEREACAERAKGYVRKSYNPVLGVQIIVPEELIAAIKEAPDA